MKKVLYLLITAQMLSCDFSGKKTSNPNDIVDTVGGDDPVTYPTTYVNTAFGYSVPILDGVKRFVNPQIQSYCFIDAQTESKTDIVVIVPFTQSLEEIAQQLENEGTPFQKTDKTIIVSEEEPDRKSVYIYSASPYGGGILSSRVITGVATFSVKTIDDLLNGIRFDKPQASLEERNQLLATDIQRQNESNDEQRLQNLRNSLSK